VLSLASGMLISRLRHLPESLPARLNQFVIYFALPAIILLKIPGLDKSATLWIPMVSCWAAITFSAILTYLICKYAKWSDEVSGALLMLVPLGNTSYLGFPAIKLLLSDSALPYAILYDQLGNFIALAIYGTLITSIYKEKLRFNAGEAEQVNLYHRLPALLLHILKFPPFIALLISLTLTQPPESIRFLLEIMAELLVPMTMFIVGLQFRLKVQAGLRTPLAIGLGIKMLISPLAILAGLSLLNIGFGMNEQNRLLLHTTLILESGMPPMVTAGVMAMAAGLSKDLCVAMVGIGMLCAALTLPLLRYILIPGLLS
jgi:hypothetical protein